MAASSSSFSARAISASSGSPPASPAVRRCGQLLPQALQVRRRLGQVAQALVFAHQFLERSGIGGRAGHGHGLLELFGAGGHLAKIGGIHFHGNRSFGSRYAKRAGRSHCGKDPARRANQRLLGGRLLGVALVEAVHATFGVDELRLAREIGMAGGAGVDAHALDRRTGLEHVPARAGNRRFFVLGMDVFFHVVLGFRVRCLRKLPEAKSRGNYHPFADLGKRHFQGKRGMAFGPAL
jgi:hypothetical protein